MASASLSGGQVTHNKSNDGIYDIYIAMKARCKYKRFHRYAGRGITVCDRWLESFENFYEDMGDRPDGRSLDRIDNDGNYSLENCRWATNAEQTRNTCCNVHLTRGNLTATIKDWAALLKVNSNMLYKRYYQQFPNLKKMC